MTVKITKSNRKWGTALEGSRASGTADTKGEVTLQTVSEDVAAWWAELDANVLADGLLPSAKEVTAIDAMPPVNVTDSVAKLMSVLPLPPTREPTQILEFKRPEDMGAYDNALSPVFQGEWLSCSKPAKSHPRHSHAQHARKLWLERYVVESSNQLEDAMVGWINFNHGARLRPLTSALRLAREIVATEHLRTFRCLTLDGRGNDRYSAKWSFLVDWLREHHSRNKLTTWRVLDSLHRVLKREQTHRIWTFRQLRTTVVFTVVGADTTSSCYYQTQVWQSTFIGPVLPSQTYGGYAEISVPMTVIDGDDVMSVVPHAVDDAVRSAVVAYYGYEPHGDSGLSAPSYLPMIREALDGERGAAHP